MVAAYCSSAGAWWPMSASASLPMTDDLIAFDSITGRLPSPIKNFNVTQRYLLTFLLSIPSFNQRPLALVSLFES